MIDFFIEGLPVAQGRPRFSTRGGYARVYDPEKSRVWKKYVETLAVSHMKRHGLKMLDGALTAEILFYLPRPKSLPKKVKHHVKKPDLTNLVKGIEDALNGVCYKDDSQIIQLLIVKSYALFNPGVKVSITEIQ